MRNRLIAVLVWILGTGIGAYAQTPAPPTQHFVVSGNAAYSGQAGNQTVAIASAGFQLTKYISVAATSITNPTDSSKPRFSMGDLNVTYELGDLLPGALKKKLVFDTTNWLITFQGSAGKVSAPGIDRVAAGAGAYISRPVANNMQLTCGYRVIHGLGNTLVKVPSAGINFTF